MSVKSSSTDKCRKASLLCYKVEILEKQVIKSSKEKADLKIRSFYFYVNKLILVTCTNSEIIYEVVPVSEKFTAALQG